MPQPVDQAAPPAVDRPWLSGSPWGQETYRFGPAGGWFDHLASGVRMGEFHVGW
jgi:hypothetical protein